MTRLTDKTELPAGSIADSDLIHVVDTSDVSSHAQGTSKKYAAAGLKEYADKSLDVPLDVSGNHTITHNFNRKPSVVVTDSVGVEQKVSVQHTSNNELVLLFNAEFTGSANLS